MKAHDRHIKRRRLLTNIETLVKRPAQADVKTMSDVLDDLGALYSEHCGRKVTFLAVCAEVPGNQEQLDEFKKTITGTKQEQGKSND